MIGWIIFSGVLFYILIVCGRNSIVRFLFALIAAPFVAIPGFASIVFFSQIIGKFIGIELFENVNWMTSDVYTHPMAIAMIIFFFIGFLNPRLYSKSSS